MSTSSSCPKEKVYVNKILQQLKNNIQTDIKAVATDILKSVIGNALEKVRSCL